MIGFKPRPRSPPSHVFSAYLPPWLHIPSPQQFDHSQTHAREYNHLLAIHLVAQILPVHALTVLVFIVLGGFLASLNHTRFDIKAPGVLDFLYQVRPLCMV